MLLGMHLFSLLHNPLSDAELFFKTIEEKTNVAFNTCELISEENTHGGFLGDGTTQKIYNCYHQNIKKKQLKNELKPLPLSNNLMTEIMTNFPSEENIHPENIIKEITNGYYFFIDNYAVNYENNKNIYSDENISKRPSKNYTLGIYDLDTKKFYYFEVDT